MLTTSGRVKRKNAPQLAKTVVKLSPVDQLEEALQARDFSKATTMLEFFRNANETIGNYPISPWLAYSAFHMHDFAKAIEALTQVLSQSDADPMYNIYLGCCHFFSGSYPDAEKWALEGPECPLQNRLLLHVALKMNDAEKVTLYESKLHESAEDQLSLAASLYARNQYQEAVEVYKKIMTEAREYVALNVYVAMCYYKMDFFDVSLEVLAPYLQKQHSSASAINLKACNHYRMDNGKSAERELKVLVDLQRTTYNVENDIVKHNLVVFRSGEDALQVLPPLLNLVPEARLNLVIYHLRHDQINEAHDLVKNMEPVTPQEYILKAVVLTWIGQQQNSPDALRVAAEYFSLVGSAQTECDTIHGRQCMASLLFLQREFSEVMVYLNTVRQFFQTDDTFNYLYGISCAATGKYDEAEDALMSIKSDKIISEYSYRSWLVRAQIMNQHAKRAWELYLKMETSAESFSILKLIANDCYKVCAFYYAAKAFDVLERLENVPEYWEGKKGACIGVFQQVFAKQEPIDSLHDVIKMLEASSQQHMQERGKITETADGIVKTMRSWLKENNSKRR